MPEQEPEDFAPPPCCAPDCPREADAPCEHCGRPCCGPHFFGPPEEHDCVPVPRPPATVEEPCHPAGLVLRLGGTAYQVLYCFRRERPAPHHLLIVEPARGVAFSYEVRAYPDGSYSQPRLIPEAHAPVGSAPSSLRRRQ